MTSNNIINILSLIENDLYDIKDKMSTNEYMILNNKLKILYDNVIIINKPSNKNILYAGYITLYSLLILIGFHIIFYKY
jgi:hypothetical protein